MTLTPAARFDRYRVLATIIRDEFTTDDRRVLAEAIDYLCAPDGTGEWASAGVYSFWRPDTHELLYIGLAVDLAQRFRQHTGLIAAPASGCKLAQINSYFEEQGRLGYAALVQSNLNQPLCSRAIKEYGDDPPDEVAAACNAGGGVGKRAVGFTEGLLIEAYNKKHESRPSWNKMGGSLTGAERATKAHSYILDVFTGRTGDVMEARRTIRALAENYTWQHYENFLHAIRQLAAGTNRRFSVVFPGFPDPAGTRERIVGDGYLTPDDVTRLEEAETRWFK